VKSGGTTSTFFLLEVVVVVVVVVVGVRGGGEGGGGGGGMAVGVVIKCTGECRSFTTTATAFDGLLVLHADDDHVG